MKYIAKLLFKPTQFSLTNILELPLDTTVISMERPKDTPSQTKLVGAFNQEKALVEIFATLCLKLYYRQLHPPPGPEPYQLGLID